VGGGGTTAGKGTGSGTGTSWVHALVVTKPKATQAMERGCVIILLVVVMRFGSMC
jgi:hypothetical protein